MKSEHPSPNELLRFKQGTGSPAELRAVETHLFDCPDCREIVAADLRRRVSVMWTEETDDAANDHLSWELMAAVVDGRADETECELAAAHVSICSMCEGEFRAVELAREEVNTQRRSRAWRFILPAAAAAIVVALLLIPKQETSEPPRRPAPPRAAAVAPRELLFIDRTGPVYRDRGGNLSGVPAYWEPMLREALGGRVARAGDAYELQPEHDALRGEDGSRGIELLQPAGVVIDETRPVFRWRRHGHEGSVRVAIYDRHFRAVSQSRPITSTQWIPDAPLPRGETYQWQITLIGGDQPAKYPRPPVAPPRFRILDEKRHEEIVRAREGSGHAAALVLMLRAGLVEDAKRELQSLRALNPRSAWVDALARAGGLEKPHQPAPTTTNGAQ